MTAGLGLVLWGTFAGAFKPAEPAPEPQAALSQVAELDVGEARPLPPGVVDYNLIDARLRQLVASPNMVGMAVGIVEGGEIRFLKGYGITAAGSEEPVTANTIFRWASLSKGVAGDMVAKLAHEDKLSLYEPVARYSTTLRLPGGGEHRATISDLLSHRLGIFSHAQDSKLESGIDAKVLRGSLATLNQICSPGQCHAYQNVAYDAASEVVEKVTGKSYQQVVIDRLFRPLGMNSASLSMQGLVTAPSWARPHVGGRNSKPVEVVDSYYRVPAAGGVNSSIKDLALWMTAQMGEVPEVLPREVLSDVQSPRAATPGQRARLRKFRERVSRASYGLGWRVYDYAGHAVVAHHGGVRGYRSLIMFDPALKSGVVALWNSPAGQPAGLEYEVMDMVYRLPARDWLNLQGKGAPPAEPAGEEASAV